MCKDMVKRQWETVLSLKAITAMYVLPNAVHATACSLPLPEKYLSFSYRRCILYPFQCCVLTDCLFLGQISTITLIVKKWKLNRKLWLDN